MLGDLDVSRETIERLKIYEKLLKKWNPAINLVAKSTIKDAWTRHIRDSTQIYGLANHPVAHWADLGSGGGFPGMAIAIIAMETNSPTRTTLVESDIRKATFLRTVARETGANVDVKAERIESCDHLAADILSARALADLTTLLSFAEQHLADGGQALFLKGASWEKELRDAQSKWRFDWQVAKSQTEQGPAILSISGVSRV